ncbi:hypothetical protein Tco_0761695 [Tanacetum coccineum]
MCPPGMPVSSGPEGAPSATKPIIEERTKVAINPKYSEQTVMIGFTLTEEGRNKLCELLQRNLDIFAWKPAGYERGAKTTLRKHRLNVQRDVLWNKEDVHYLDYAVPTPIWTTSATRDKTGRWNPSAVPFQMHLRRNKKANHQLQKAKKMKRKPHSSQSQDIC